MERRLARSLKPEGAASNLDFVFETAKWFNINRIKTDKNVRLDST